MREFLDFGGAEPATDFVTIHRLSLITILDAMRTPGLPAQPRQSDRAPDRVLGEPQIQFAHSDRKGGLAGPIYGFRRARDRIFGEKLFGEPCWDILLDLMAAQENGKMICVSSACIAASVPHSTALRCIFELENRGLVRRSRDHADGRRIYLELTDACSEKLEELFSTVATR